MKSVYNCFSGLIIKLLPVVLLLAIGLGSNSCTTGVEKSPLPGYLKVTLQSNPSDSTITIGDQKYSISDKGFLNVTVYQGAIYNDSVFTDIFSNLKEYTFFDHSYNILSLDKQGAPKKFVIFDSRIPPGAYDSLRFGLSANSLLIGDFQIPVQLPPDAPQLYGVHFNEPLQIKESDTTVVNLQINTFKSVQRYRNSFYFDRKINIKNIEVR